MFTAVARGYFGVPAGAVGVVHEQQSLQNEHGFGPQFSENIFFFIPCVAFS